VANRCHGCLRFVARALPLVGLVDLGEQRALGGARPAYPAAGPPQHEGDCDRYCATHDGPAT
jgi:hypothetical protein